MIPLARRRARLDARLRLGGSQLDRDLSARWEYSASTAEAVLAAVVAASVGLVGLRRHRERAHRADGDGHVLGPLHADLLPRRAFKAVLAVLIGTFTFSYTLMRHVEEDDVPNLGVTMAGVVPRARDPALRRLPRPRDPPAPAGRGRGARRRGRPEGAARGARGGCEAGRARGRTGSVQPSGRAGARRSDGARRRDPGDRLPRAREVGPREREPRRAAPSGRRLRLRRGDADRALRARSRAGGGRASCARWSRSASSGRSSRIRRSPSGSWSTSRSARSLRPSTTRRPRCRCSTTSEDLLRLVGSDRSLGRGHAARGDGHRARRPGPSVGRLPDARASRRSASTGRRRSRSSGACARCSTSCRRACCPSDARRCCDELARLDEAVAARWGATVDVDLAGRSDRQGIGGPSATTAE